MGMLLGAGSIRVGGKYLGGRVASGLTGEPRKLTGGGSGSAAFGAAAPWLVARGLRPARIRRAVSPLPPTAISDALGVALLGISVAIFSWMILGTRLVRRGTQTLGRHSGAVPLGRRLLGLLRAGRLVSESVRRAQHQPATFSDSYFRQAGFNSCNLSLW